jgi:hypothetical protein
MNERIRELAEQAEMAANKGDHVDVKIMMAKFAELIIQECMNKIENEASQYAEPVWAVELINDIKEHFGVEE